MLFECYLDDSKDKRQEFAYVCAGFYGAKWAWKAFNREWNAQLKAEGLAYFKTSEWKRLMGEFEKFKLLEEPRGREAANLVRERMQAVLARTPGLHGIGVAVPVAEMHEVMQHAGAHQIFSPNLYHRAFEGTLLKATELACYRHDKLAFIHDNGDDFAELFTLYNAFKRVNPATAKRMAGFIPLDDKLTPALQIADMFANDIMGRTVEFIKGQDANAEEIFMYHRSRLFSWDKNFGEVALVANLERRNLPIPESLAPALDRLNKSK